MINLNGKVQNYDWGKIGEDSKVAQLTKANDPTFSIQSQTPYAELWMGTHTNGESTIKESDEKLSKWIIDKNVDVDGQLPFLFKVLSINKALSIQCHPTKDQAIQLNAARPDIYKDPNHKPELAIALTEFKAMCGFRKYDEIKEYLQKIPELVNIIGETIVNNFTANPTKESLEKCFKSLMIADEVVVTKNLEKLLLRFSTLDDEHSEILLKELFNNLLKQFPNDIGVLCIYFLNVLDLKPGEAIYLGPTIPHAYISGDCVECMACSDNVIRAGLTPKYKDVDTLIKILDYNDYSIDDMIFKPIQEDKFVSLFKPPVDDFAVAKIIIPFSEKTSLQRVCDTHSIILVVSGQAKSNIGPLITGMIVFIGSSKKLQIDKEAEDEFVMYQAMSSLESRRN